jgi:predicted nuclease with TOPRIM domain
MNQENNKIKLNNENMNNEINQLKKKIENYQIEIEKFNNDNKILQNNYNNLNYNFIELNGKIILY